MKLPAQILDPEDARFGAFTANRNALVEDPKAELELLKHTRPWAEWEKKIFHEKFASYGKNFKRVATFIDGRTTAECVTYYYQRQKTDDGFKSRRRAQAKKRRAYAEAKRMTGGAWNGPGGPSAGGMSAAALAKASREREAELRAAEEERKGRSAEARQERAALAAAEKKKAKEKAAREKRKREKEKETEKEKASEKKQEAFEKKQEASESAEAGDAEAGAIFAPKAGDPAAAAAQMPAAAQPPGVAAAPNVSGAFAGGGEAAPAAGTKRKAAAAAEAPTKGKGKGKKAAKTELPDASLQWGVGVEEEVTFAGGGERAIRVLRRYDWIIHTIIHTNTSNTSIPRKRIRRASPAPPFLARLLALPDESLDVVDAGDGGAFFGSAAILTRVVRRRRAFLRRGAELGVRGRHGLVQLVHPSERARVHPVDVQDPVQVVHLVLRDARLPPLRDEVDGLAVAAQSAHAHGEPAFDEAAVPLHGEASLEELCGFGSHWGHDRVDHHLLVERRAFARRPNPLARRRSCPPRRPSSQTRGTARRSAAPRDRRLGRGRS